ncbi:hypothetical protein Tco_0453750 [Tanacetum coccineum]
MLRSLSSNSSIVEVFKDVKDLIFYVDVLGFAAVLAVLVTGASQSKQHVSTSLIHIESCKSPTAELFEVDSGRISIRHCEY